MSANGNGGDGEPFRVVSTNRPLPRQARDDLEEFGIVGELTAEEVDNPPLGVSPQTTVGLLVEERPTDDALDRSELKLIEDPIETWEGRGAEVWIYPTKVVSSDDGEMGLDPEEAAEFVRDDEDFSPVDVPDDSPFGPTPDDLLTPDEGRAKAREFRNEHSTVGRWRATPESEWDDDRARFSQETVAEWASPKRDGGRIYVTVSMDPNDGEDDDADEPPTFDVNTSVDGDLKHSSGPAVGGVLEDDIDSVLEGTLTWMENRPAVTNYPSFRAEVKKGVIHPAFDVMSRISGGKAFLEADEQGIRVYTGGLHQVEYDLPASDMEEYDLKAAGACVLEQKELLDAISSPSFTTTITIEGIGSERTFVFNGEQADMWAAASHGSGEIEVDPGSAQGIVDGQRFKEGIQTAARLNGKTEALFAIQNADVWLAFKAVTGEDGETLDELKYDFRGRSVIGEAATTVRMSTVDGVKRAFERPSRNDVTLNVEDRGRLVLNYNQQANYAAGNGGNITVSLNRSGSVDGFDLTPPRAPDAPEGVSPVDTSSIEEPEDRIPGVTDAIEGLFEVGPVARGWILDAERSGQEEHPIIQRLEEWVGALEEVRPALASQLVGDPTEEAVATAEVFADNMETLNDAAKDLLSMTEDDPDLPETDAIPGFERQFSGEPAPESTESEESANTIPEPTAYTDTPGSWDAALVARPGRPWGERYEAIPLDQSDRRNPEVELTDDAAEEIEDKFSGVPAAQYRDGDVVALAGLDTGVRGGVDVRSFTADPGVELLRDRTTDPDDGSLRITPDDGWVGIHPDDVFKLDDGDLTAGWTTAPARRTDSRNNFHVWWGGRMESAYHYRETQRPPYFVYEWDTDAEQPNFQTGTLADSPGQRYHLWARKVPDGDEAIGLVPGTDSGPTPADPVFRSEYDDEYEMFPFVRSQDAASELVGETILARTSGGMIREADVTGEADRFAGIRVADEQIADGFWAVPASSEHEDSTFELVGVPKGNDDKIWDVDVLISESSGGFSAGSARISLDPEIGDDPNNIGQAIRRNVSDTFPRDGLRRFFTSQREQIATAKVRGGDLVEEEIAQGMTTEKLSEPLELVDVEYSVDTPEGDENPTADEIREAFPALSTPQAESVAELVWDVDGVLQFTPAGLMSIDGIGDSTVGDLIGGSPGFNSTTPIGEQGAERQDTDEPPDDFGRTIEGTFSDEVIEEGEVEEEIVAGGPFEAGTAGRVQVGRRTIDVPAAGDWGEQRFYWRQPETSDSLDGDGIISAYISADRSTVLTIEGTRVSNKWGMKVYVHQNGVGGSPSREEIVGEFDGANVDQITLTSGNTADSNAENIIADNWLSPGEANQRVRDADGTGEFSWEREFDEEIETFPIIINPFGSLAAERSENNRQIPREVVEEVFERVRDVIGDPEQYVSGDVGDRDDQLVGGADIDVGGILQGATPEIIDVDAFEPVDDDGEPVESDADEEEPEPDEEPEPEPDDEPADLPFETAITEFSDANLQETAWSHIERDLGANPEILFLNDDRTLGIHGKRVELSDQDIFEAVGIRFSEPVPEGEVRDLRSETAENSTVVGSDTDIFEFALGIIQENPPEAVREQLDEKTGTGEEEVSETLSKLARALTDADNLLDRARNVGAMGTQELQRIQRSVQELERAVDNLEQVPMSSDVEDANETIERFRNREEDAEEVIESASGSPDEGDDGELTRAEVETIVENATEGVAVNAPTPAGNLTEIQMRSVGDFDIPERINAGTTAGTRREAIRIAVERWEEAVDLSKVDAERANKAREALNRQFSLDLPLIEVEESEPGPEPDPDEEAGVDPDGDIVAQLEDEFARELGGMGLPSRPRPPADFVVEEDMGRISARPNVPAEWEPVLQDQPGVVTGSIDDPDEFLADYLERLFQAIDFSKVDAAAINKKRARLNERFGLDLPLLNAQGEPQAGTEAGEDTGTEETGREAASQRVEPLRVQGGVYIVPDDVPAGTAEEARNQAEAALGPADQFDNNTRVGEAIIQDGQVAVRVEEGERILDARRQQEDLEERKPDFDMDAPLTAETVREAFPRMLGNGKAFADEFDTLGEMVNAPLSRVESIYGVGMGTVERFIDSPEPEMDASIMDQRRRPLGIEDDVPDDSPMPEIKTDEEVEDVPEGTTGGVPEVAVSIPPTAPRGEKWMAQQIQRGNRIQPNKYDENPIVEIVFPERISGQVRNVVAQYDISRGRQTVSVQNPSFRDELPEEAAALKSIQFLLTGGNIQPANDLRSSGYDIQQIINDLSDRLIIVTRSPIVRAPITFPN